MSRDAVVRSGDLAEGWIEIPIPDSSPPGQLLRFSRDEASGAFTCLSRFPEGWNRPVTGYYQAEEEFYLLEGDLQVGEVRYEPGDYARLPAGTLRGVSRSRTGALALAAFSRPGGWTASASDAPGADRSQLVPRLHLEVGMLSEGKGSRTWLARLRDGDSAPKADELFIIRGALGDFPAHSYVWQSPVERAVGETLLWCRIVGQ